jgi:ABC-type sugar transport system permease subunit
MISNKELKSSDIFKNFKMNKKLLLAIPFFLLTLLFIIIPLIIIITYAFLPTSAGSIEDN